MSRGSRPATEGRSGAAMPRTSKFADKETRFFTRWVQDEWGRTGLIHFHGAAIYLKSAGVYDTPSPPSPRTYEQPSPSQPVDVYPRRPKSARTTLLGSWSTPVKGGCSRDTREWSRR